jgi:hypothetical protein
MDENEDIKTPSAIPGGAGEPANPPALPPAGTPAAIELASVESPALAPTMTDMTAEGPGLDAPNLERPSERSEERLETAEKFEGMKPASPDHPAPASRDVILAAPTIGRASRTFSKFTLAATVVLAAAFGAMAGVLGATGVARLTGETATTAPEPPALQTTLAQLQSDVAALTASVEATGHNTGAQYRANKTDAALPKEITGSVTLPSAAAAPLPPASVPSSPIVPGWAVRDVYRGVAMLQSRVGGMVEVEPGDVLPGLGRIESIRRQDGRWVVITSKGMITSMR